MLKKLAFLILTTISLTLFGQNAAELNEQSKNKNQRFKGATADKLKNRISRYTSK